MRFFHIADVHLGAEPDKGCPWSEDRGREIWDSFRNTIRQAGREHADLFLIAGDLFHRQPLKKELKEVNYLFSTIPKTRVVLIAGNHDCMRPESAYKKITWADNVFWLDQTELSHVDFPELHTRVYGLSYDRKEISKPLYEGVRAEGGMPVEILLAHGGDAKHIPFTKETFAQSGFSYVALGHIHKPHVLLENQAAYAGALEPLDKTETGPHGYIKGECTPESTRIAFVPVAVREYKKIRMRIHEKTTQFSLEQTIRKVLEDKGKQHLYCISLEGRRALETEFLTDRLYDLGNIRELEDHTIAAYSIEALKQQYAGSILEAYIHNFQTEGRTEEEEKALRYGIEALLASM